MFRWLRQTRHDFATDYICSINPSYRLYLESDNKKRYLEQQLSDAEWILDCERRLAALQKEVAHETSGAARAGRNPECLQKLSRELTHLRSNLADWCHTA